MSVTRLVAPSDAPALAELVRVNRDFLAPSEPARREDYFTVGGQRGYRGRAGAVQARIGPSSRHPRPLRPHNVRSQRVLERGGFARIGVAPAYLNIAGTWQDHIPYQVVNITPARPPASGGAA